MQNSFASFRSETLYYLVTPSIFIFRPFRLFIDTEALLYELYSLGLGRWYCYSLLFLSKLFLEAA